MDILYDVSLNLCYTSGNLRINGGYQLNGHGKEKHKSWVDTLAGSKYGLLATSATGISGATTGAASSSVAAAGGNNDDSSTTVTVSGNTGATVSAPFTAARSLTHADLNTASGLAPSAMAHRLHGGVHYSWADSEWEPAVGVYGGGQLGQDNTALSGWFVGFNGSVCF